MSLSVVAADYALGKVLDHTAGAMLDKVIQRWSRMRAERFFAEFCKRVNASDQPGTDEEIREKLDELFGSDTRTEVLFDAYRRVSLSKSNDLGPRLIGLIVARIVAEDRQASEDEDLMLMGAEHLSDRDLRDLAAYVREQKCKAEAEGRSAFSGDGYMVVRVGEEHFDSRSPNALPRPISFSAASEGMWALHCRNLGLITEDVEEINWFYREDTERHIDQDGSARMLVFSLFISKAGVELAHLVDELTDQASPDDAEERSSD